MSKPAPTPKEPDSATGQSGSSSLGIVFFLAVERKDSVVEAGKRYFLSVRSFVNITPISGGGPVRFAFCGLADNGDAIVQFGEQFDDSFVMHERLVPIGGVLKHTTPWGLTVKAEVEAAGMLGRGGFRKVGAA